jgi:translation initiation factor eIF-2B subunit gamma
VYNRFAHFWNLVDRINEDFHGFHHLPGEYSALKHGLESAIFLAVMAARVIWEEHRCARAYALAGQSKRAVEAVQRRTIPEFIVAAAQQLVKKKQESLWGYQNEPKTCWLNTTITATPVVQATASHEMTSQVNQEFQVVILAGGAGTRLWPLSESVPKPLLPVANRPLLSYQLELVESVGFRHVLVITQEAYEPALRQYLAQDYPGSSLEVELISFKEYLGTADVLFRIKDRLKRDFLLVSGDLIADPSFLHPMADLHRSEDACLTCLLKEQPPAQADAGSAAKSRGREDEEQDLVGLDTTRRRLLVLVSRGDLDEDLRLPRGLLLRYPHLYLHTTMLDAHLYIVSRHVWEVVGEARRKKLHSVKGELVPFLLRCQLRQTRLPAEPAGPPLPHAAGDVVLASAGLLTDLRSSQALVLPACAGRDAGAGTVAGPSGADAQPWAYRLSASPARDELRDRVRCLAHLMEREQTCLRVNTVRAYLEANRLVAAGACGPFRPNEPASRDSKGFWDPGAEVHARAQVGPGCVLGDACQVQERCVLKQTVLGRRCRIGQGARLVQCVLMDGCQVGENAQLTNCVLCPGVRIGDRCVLKDCLLGRGLEIAPGTELKNEQLSQADSAD